MVWSGRQARWLTLAGTALTVLGTSAPAWATPIISLDLIEAAPASDYTPDTLRFAVATPNASNPAIFHVLNIADCKAIKAAINPKVRITWSWLNKGFVVAPIYSVKVSAPGKSCDLTNLSTTQNDTTGGCEAPVALNKSFLNTTAAGEQTDLDMRLLLGDTLCTSGVDGNASLDFIVNEAVTPGATATGAGIAVPITIDLTGPGTPTLSSVSAGGNNLKVIWTYVDTSASNAARVYWSTKAFSAADLGSAPHNGCDKTSGICSSDKLTGTAYQITGLTNGVPYNVAVVAVDEHDNESTPSAIKSASPIEVQDLWQYYKAKGGAEEGGYAPCSASPDGRARSGLLGLLAIVGLLLVVRRRKSLGGLTILLLALGVALPGRSEAASPQTSSLDLRVGSYTPQIDREFANTNGATPYGKVVSDGAYEVGFTIDWRIWHKFGEFAMGVGAARWTKDGHGLTLAGDTTSDTTTLSIVPISVDAVYRFDVLAERYDFPLVPYARAGIVYALWWMENGVGNISRTTIAGKTEEAQGGTGGFQGAIGMRLLLDVFEPQAARSFDIEMGVNHSYLFAEYRKLVLTDFGNPKSIDLSDGIFAFGLAFDL
jgi:MYXO-CTERM domain-containing protein